MESRWSPRENRMTRHRDVPLMSTTDRHLARYWWGTAGPQSPTKAWSVTAGRGRPPADITTCTVPQEVISVDAEMTAFDDRPARYTMRPLHANTEREVFREWREMILPPVMVKRAFCLLNAAFSVEFLVLGYICTLFWWLAGCFNSKCLGATFTHSRSVCSGSRFKYISAVHTLWNCSESERLDVGLLQSGQLRIMMVVICCQTSTDTHVLFIPNWTPHCDYTRVQQKDGSTST